MKQKKLLFIGFGDIATRASRLFLADACAVTGIARSERQPPAGVDYWRGAMTDSHVLQQLAQQTFDVVVVTLTPAGRAEADYQHTYVETTERLVRLWQSSAARPALVIFVSSTSVYQQHQGEEVDENSPAEPSSPAARRLLAAEMIWANSTLNSCIVRFSGIYGPGRDHLLRQVKAGKGGPRHNSPYTNRIHVDDCVGVIRHLCQRHWAGEQLEPLYLASDNTPATSWEVRSWLAEHMGYPGQHLQETPAEHRGGSKRCSNARIRASGYRFKYGDYRSGYASLLASNN